MTADEVIKPEKVISEYFAEKRDRFRIIEKNRNDKEKILERRREIEEKRKEKDSKVCPEKPANTMEWEQIISFVDKVHMLKKKDETVNDDNEADSNEDEEENEFSLWLKSISQCLSGKISHDQIRPASPESEEEEEEEELDEDARCMKIVKSVFDEETASMLVKTYLKYLKVIII